MKEKFRAAYRVRRIRAKRGNHRVDDWNDPIEVAAYLCWAILEDAKYFQMNRAISNQYSWF